MLWPLPDERYAYPIVGFVLVSVIETFLRVGKFLLKNINSRSHFDFKKIILGFLALLLLHNVIFVIWAFDFNDNIILKPPNKEMVEWIKTHTKPNEHFMFPKPRVIGLLTGRVGTPLWIFPAQQAQMTERVKKFNIDYRKDEGVLAKLLEVLSGRKERRERIALKDVSFSARSVRASLSSEALTASKSR